MIVAIRSALMGVFGGFFMLGITDAPDWACVQTALLITCVFLTVEEQG